MPHMTSHTLWQVYVPVIVFRNHKRFDPLLASSGEFHINVPLIEQQLQKLALPHQKVEVVSQTQELADHVAVSRSIARAIRDDTVHEPSKKADGRYVMRMRPYMDSAIIRHEFNHSLHILDSIGPTLLKGHPDLWSFFHPAVPPTLDGARSLDDVDSDPLTSHDRLQLSHGTRVLPVYIFSLLGLQRDLLIDQARPRSSLPLLWGGG